MIPIFIQFPLLHHMALEVRKEHAHLLSLEPLSQDQEAPESRTADMFKVLQVDDQLLLSAIDKSPFSISGAVTASILPPIVRTVPSCTLRVSNCMESSRITADDYEWGHSV